MSQNDVATLRAAYEAFNRQDVPAVVAVLDPNIEWIEPVGEKSPHGTLRGPQAVVEGVFVPIGGHFDQFRIDVREVWDAGNRLVATGHVQGKTKSDKSVDMPFAHIWTVDNGKATGFQAFVDADAWAAVWA